MMANIMLSGEKNTFFVSISQSMPHISLTFPLNLWLLSILLYIELFFLLLQKEFKTIKSITMEAKHKEAFNRRWIEMNEKE